MSDSSDRPLLDLIRRRGPLTVAEMSDLLNVTPTAIRNRLTRLIGSGMVERRSESGNRGRPRHTYRASAEAHRRLGQNYADLAVALWGELMHAVEDRKLRRLLFGPVTDRLPAQYRDQGPRDQGQRRSGQRRLVAHGRGCAGA